MIKIIAGRLKGRNIPTLPGNRYRPSHSRLREALFSILASGIFLEQNILENAIVLDLFAGTGSLSFEALSRGAKHCTLVDIDADHLKMTLDAAKKFKEDHNISCLRLDAAYLPIATKQYNLVFIDPPYNSDLAGKSLKSICKRGWISNGAIIVVEMAKNENLQLPTNYNLLTERIYGNSKLLIFKYDKS